MSDRQDMLNQLLIEQNTITPEHQEEKPAIIRRVFNRSTIHIVDGRIEPRRRKVHEEQICTRLMQNLPQKPSVNPTPSECDLAIARYLRGRRALATKRKVIKLYAV